MPKRVTALVILASFGSLAVGCGGPSPAATFGTTQGNATIVRDLIAGLDRNGDKALEASEAEVFLSATEFRQADRNRDGKVTAAELDGFLSARSNPAPGQGIRAEGLGGIAIGIGLGLGAVTAGYLTYAGLKGAGDVMWPGLNHATTKPAEIGLVAEDVVLDADIVGLKGWYVSAARPTDKCIIFQHGHGGNKSQFLEEFVPWLAQKYNVLTFDFRGCGESPKVPSSLGYFEAQEVATAIGFAHSRGNTSIGLMGLSMGAASAMIAGAKDPAVKGVVEDCSFSDWYHAFRPRVVNRKYPLPGPVAVAIEKTLELKLGVKAEGASPVKHINKWAGRPVFIIHGDADTDTTPENAKLLFGAASEPKTLWMVPGAGHADSHEVAGEEYERRVMDFWAKTL